MFLLCLINIAIKKVGKFLNNTTKLIIGLLIMKRCVSEVILKSGYRMKQLHSGMKRSVFIMVQELHRNLLILQLLRVTKSAKSIDCHYANVKVLLIRFLAFCNYPSFVLTIVVCPNVYQH